MWSLFSEELLFLYEADQIIYTLNLIAGITFNLVNQNIKIYNRINLVRHLIMTRLIRIHIVLFVSFYNKSPRSSFINKWVHIRTFMWHVLMWYRVCLSSPLCLSPRGCRWLPKPLQGSIRGKVKRLKEKIDHRFGGWIVLRSYETVGTATLLKHMVKWSSFLVVVS